MSSCSVGRDAPLLPLAGRAPLSGPDVDGGTSLVVTGPKDAGVDGRKSAACTDELAPNPICGPSSYSSALLVNRLQYASSIMPGCGPPVGADADLCPPPMSDASGQRTMLRRKRQDAGGPVLCGIGAGLGALGARAIRKGKGCQM